MIIYMFMSRTFRFCFDIMNYMRVDECFETESEQLVCASQFTTKNGNLIFAKAVFL